jgi:hypothetical protein
VNWLAALAAITIGVFFTHRAFVLFVIELLRARNESHDELQRHLGTMHLVRETAMIVAGIVPLVWGAVRLAQLA